MRFSLVSVVSILCVLLTLEVAAATLVGPSQGYVIYKISINGQQTPTETFNVNENVQPGGQNGFVILTVNVESSSRNFTYSNVMNSSSVPEIFPYLVGINNQSFSYGTAGSLDIIHVQNRGSVPVMFNGSTYEGTTYQVTVSITYTPRTLQISGNGTIITLPSGLIYSVTLQNINGYSVSAQLMRTSLPVTVASGSSLPVGLALVSIGLVGAIAFAVPSVFIRWRRKLTAKPAPPAPPQSEEKPSYWVD